MTFYCSLLYRMYSNFVSPYLNYVCGGLSLLGSDCMYLNFMFITVFLQLLWLLSNSSVFEDKWALFCWQLWFKIWLLKICKNSRNAPNAMMKLIWTVMPCISKLQLVYIMFIDSIDRFYIFLHEACVKECIFCCKFVINGS